MKSEATCAYSFVRNYTEHKEALLKRFSQESCFGSEKKKSKFSRLNDFRVGLFSCRCVSRGGHRFIEKGRTEKIDLNAFGSVVEKKEVSLTSLINGQTK